MTVIKIDFKGERLQFTVHPVEGGQLRIIDGYNLTKCEVLDKYRQSIFQEFYQGLLKKALG